MALYSLTVLSPLGLPPSTGKNTLVAMATASTVVQVAQPDPARIGLTNPGNKTVFLGFTNAVTAANYAIAIAAGQAYEFPNSYTGGVWAISGSAAQSVNVVEMS
jgi:hypothetical protein